MFLRLIKSAFLPVMSYLGVSVRSVAAIAVTLVVLMKYQSVLLPGNRIQNRLEHHLPSSKSNDTFIVPLAHHPTKSRSKKHIQERTVQIRPYSHGVTNNGRQSTQTSLKPVSTDVCKITNKTTIGHFTFGEQTTPEFLPDFKNPCWRSDIFNRTMCVPYVYLAGFPKSGTTDLFMRLLKHPHIFPATKKEPHYISRFVGGNDTITDARREWCTPRVIKAAKTSCALLVYSKQFFDLFARVTTQNIAKTYFFKDHKGRFNIKNTTSPDGGYKHPLITVDASASTAWDNKEWTDLSVKNNCPEVMAGIPPFVKRINSKAKIIFILRDPVERTFSDFLYFSGSTSMELFQEKALTFIDFFNGCLHQGKSIRTCTYLKQDRLGTTRHALAIYHVYIKDWMETFPKEQLYVTRTEDYHSNMWKVMDDIFSFLELPALDNDSMATIAADPNIRNKNKNKKNMIMLPETRRLLEEFYRPHNEMLATLMGDPGMTWEYMGAR